MHVSEINIYPIKSLRGISLQSAVVEKRGLAFDRRWMLTDASGRFMTQREFPKMATIDVGLDDGAMTVSADDFGCLNVPLIPATGDIRQVTIWQSVCAAEAYDRGIGGWFSDVLGTTCDLVYMPDDTQRSVNSRFDGGSDIVSFADGYPLLVICEASLRDLNSRIAGSYTDEGDVSAFRPLPMNRFRPNIVVSGSEPYAEDDWTGIRVGDAAFRTTKPCERCVIPTVDQSRGEFDGKEPLRTLATYRMAKDVMPERIEPLGVTPNAVLFGQNLIPTTSGLSIKLGDTVDVVESRR